MKEFFEPQLNVLPFQVEDIITISVPVEEDNGVVLPPHEFKK